MAWMEDRERGEGGGELVTRRDDDMGLSWGDTELMLSTPESDSSASTTSLTHLRSGENWLI